MRLFALNIQDQLDTDYNLYNCIIEMKAISVSVIVTLSRAQGAWAQVVSETVTAKKKKRSVVPVAVVESNEEGFPESGVSDQEIVPAEAYQAEWVISKETIKPISYV